MAVKQNVLAGMKTTTGLFLAMSGLVGGFILPIIPSAFAAPLIQQEADPSVEPATTSQLVPAALPAGAHRAKNPDDLAKFDAVLQTTAQTNHGSIRRSEVLIWTGDDAKTALSEMPARMKEAGYHFVTSDAFDAEPGRITPAAALRPDKTNSLIGLWIETTEGDLLLVWGLFNPENPAKPGSPAKSIATAKPGTGVKNAAVKPRKTVVVSKKAQPTASKTKSANRPLSDAEKRAKALKAYQDSQYVKLMGPISGPMYRSTKW